MTCFFIKRQFNYSSNLFYQFFTVSIPLWNDGHAYNEVEKLKLELI